MIRPAQRFSLKYIFRGKATAKPPPPSPPGKNVVTSSVTFGKRDTLGKLGKLGEGQTYRTSESHGISAAATWPDNR